MQDEVARRWRLVYTRLNEVQAPEGVDGVWRQQLAWRWLDDLLLAPVPPRLHIRAARDEGEREVGPPCPECAVPVDRGEDLSACSACLRVFHHACLPDRRRCACGQPAA